MKLEKLPKLWKLLVLFVDCQINVSNQDTYRVDFFRLQFIVGFVSWIYSKFCLMSGYTDKVFLLSGKWFMTNITNINKCSPIKYNIIK